MCLSPKPVADVGGGVRSLQYLRLLSSYILLAPETSEGGVQEDMEVEAPNLGDDGLAGMF